MDELLRLFNEFRKIPKGVFISNPYVLIVTQFELSNIIIKMCSLKNKYIFFTRASLKHLAEKQELGFQLLETLAFVLRDPDELYQGNTNQKYILSKDFKLQGKPQVVIIEIVNRKNIIVTSFKTNNKYLSDFDLLWRTGTFGIPKAVPPSQRPDEQGGGSTRLSALREDQNQKE